jgi:hypothetical protein
MFLAFEEPLADVIIGRVGKPKEIIICKLP